jgi:fibronectin-binding autotransporter adhesin
MKTQTPRNYFLSLLALLLLAFGPAGQATVYYSHGNLDATLTSSWGTTTGGGSAPSSFTGADTFYIQNGHSMTTSKAWTMGSGTTLEIQSGGTLTATFLIGSLGTFKVDNGGTYYHNAPGSVVNGATADFPGSTQTMGASSTVEINQWGQGTSTGLTAALPVPTSGWGNLTINITSEAYTGHWTQGGTLTTINGNLTIKATGTSTGDFALASSQTYALTIGGNFSISGGTFYGSTSSSFPSTATVSIGGDYNQTGGTVTHNSSGGSVVWTFANNGTASSSFTLSSGTPNQNGKINYTIGSGKTMTLNSTWGTGTSGTTSSRTITVNGTLLCNGYNITGNEGFALASGGTLGITSPSGISTTAATGNIQTPSGTTTFATGANYIYNGSSAQVTGNALPTTVNNLTLNNSTGLTLSGNVLVNGTLTMTAGAVTLGGNAISYGASGTLAYNGSGSGQTTAAAEFPTSSGPASLTVANNSGVTLGFARTITGTLTLTSGTLATTSANLLTIGSAGSVSGGSSSSYVAGPLARVYGATGSKSFPVGVASYHSVALNITTISGTPTITVTPNEASAWGSGNTPANTTMFSTRDWTINSSGSGNTASLTLDGTGWSPTGSAKIEGYDGTSTTTYSTTVALPNYTSTGIALASGNNEFALGDLSCAAVGVPSIISASASCGQNTVSWGSVSGAASYNVYRKLSGGSYGSAIANVSSGTTYNDTASLSPSSTYVYAVSSISGCGAESSLSSDSSGVTPLAAPSITSAPTSVTTADGHTATFTVAATGSGTLTYQWQVNKTGTFVNVDAGGADGTGGTTASFTTVTTTTAMNGYQYQCVITGSCTPSVTTTPVTLTVGTYFKSLATGDYATSTTWQIAATSGGTYSPAPSGVTPAVTDSIEIQNGHTVTVAANTSVSANAVTIDSGGTLSVGIAGSTANASGATLNIYGNLVNNGTLTGASSASTPYSVIKFANNTTWSGGANAGVISGGKIGITVNSGATLTLNCNITLKSNTGNAPVIVNGTLNAGTYTIFESSSGSSYSTFTLAAGATLETANAGGIGGPEAANSTQSSTAGTWQSVGGMTLSSTANYIFDGAAAQVPGSGFNAAQVNNLTINNASGVTLGSTATVNGTLTLTSGNLTTTAANLLTIGSAGSISGASSSSYVNGPLAEVYTATGSKNFPVGANSDYHLVALNVTTLGTTPSTITVAEKNPSTWSSGNTPSGATMFGTRDWTVASSASSGNVCSLSVDGTSWSPSGQPVLLDYNGSGTSSFATTFASPNYTASGISLTASSELALGDCLVPGQPTITSATAATCSPVVIQWNSVSGATSYNVYRKLSGGLYGAALATVSSGTTYSDSSAAVGSTYDYAVTAVSACGGESIKSADTADLSPSGAPVAPALTSVTANCGSVTVNWGTVSGDTGGYNIYRKLSGGSYGTAIANVASGTGTYTDSTANDSTKTYVYAVTAVGSCESVASGDSSGVSPLNLGISGQPGSVTTGDSYPATFSVTVTGSGTPTYQWQVNKNDGNGFVATVDGTDGTGSAAASFTTVNSTTAMNGYQYRCLVTGGTCSSSVTSSAATLNVATHFRTQATGAWSASGTWQISVNGTSGWTAAPSGVVPGNSATVNDDTVEVVSGTTLSVDATESCASLTIDSGGSLQNTSGSSSAVPTLHIYGNLAANNGTSSYTVGATGHTTTLEFDGSSCAWTGSGDFSVSAARFGVTVATGATLDISGLTSALKLRNSGTLAVTVNGTLIAGSTQINPNGNTTSTFALGASGTLETANVNGLVSGTSATVYSSFTTITLPTTANYVFNGSSAQVTAGLPATVGNLTIANSAGVTLSSTVAVSGQLVINSGALNPGGLTTPTAGSLWFGSTLQGTGTWGNTGSGAANLDATHFAGSGYVTVLYSNGSGTQFRSTATGNWSSSGTWQVSSDGTTWAASPGLVPGANNQVYLQAGLTVTMTANAACANLDMAFGTASTDTGSAGAALNTANSTMQLYGHLRAYYAAVGTVPGTDLGSAAPSSWSPFLKTAGGTGKVEIVGASRALTSANQWSSYAYTGTQMPDCEVALNDASQTLTVATVIRFANLTITTGTVNTTSAISADNGTAGTGGAAITIGPAGKLISSATGSNAIFRRTTASPIGSVVNQGVLQLSGSAPLISAATIDFSAGTVIYAGVNQTLLASHGDAGAANPDTYSNLTLNGTSGIKKLALNTTVNGTLTVAAANTLDLNGQNLTCASAPSLSGGLLVGVSKTGANTFTGPTFTLNSGTLTYGGTLTVTNAGSTLAPGDSIPVFTSSGGFAGSFSSITLSPAVTGLSASLASGSVAIACDGTLAASAASSISLCSGDSYSLNGSATGGGGSYTYSWTSSPSGFTSALADPSVSPTTTTTYTLTVTDANGCTANAAVTVTVNPTPASTITAASSTCGNSAGNAASVPSQSGVTYAWTITGGTITAGAGTAAITYTAGASGTVGLTCVVTDSTSGCSSTSSATVTVNPVPTVTSAISLGAQAGVKQTLLILGGKYAPSGSGTLTLSLPASTTANGGVLTTDGSSVTYSNAVGYAGTDSFTYTVTDGTGCSASGTVNVHVTPVVNQQTPTITFNAGEVDLTFWGVPGTNYTVQVSPDLGSTWTDLTPDVTASTVQPYGQILFTNNPSPASGTGFYRLKP